MGWAAICCACSWQEHGISINYRLDPYISGCHGFFEALSWRIASVAGKQVFQALLRNPLADPYVLGVSSGAAVGANTSAAARAASRTVAGIGFGVTPVGGFLVRRWRSTAVYFLGRREGRIDSSTLLLGGAVITASLLSAVIILLLNTMPSSNVRGMAYC